MQEWIGFDLDGTLAHYDGWKGSEHIGEPTVLVELVKNLIANGKTIKIFTARVSDNDPRTREVIEDWTEKHIGHRLEVTCVKDYGMTVLFDDRAVTVAPNMGILIGLTNELLHRIT